MWPFEVNIEFKNSLVHHPHHHTNNLISESTVKFSYYIHIGLFAFLFWGGEGDRIISQLLGLTLGRCITSSPLSPETFASVMV